MMTQSQIDGLINDAVVKAVADREKEIAKKLCEIDLNWADDPIELLKDVGIKVPVVEEYVLIKVKFRNPFADESEKRSAIEDIFADGFRDGDIEDDWDVIGVSATGGFKV